jgi:hypothetical protein
LRARGYTEEGECVNIEGIPVQFLPAHNDLLVEALAEARESSTSRLPLGSCAEHLVAIALQTGATRTANASGCCVHRRDSIEITS